MLEGRGDNFNDVSTDRLKLELQEEMHLKEKRNLENQVKDYALRLEQESKLATGPAMSAVHTLLKCLRVRCNSVNQKTMNAMRGPVKKISRSSRLSKFNL